MIIYPLAVILSIAPLLGGIWNLEIQTFFQSLILIVFSFYLGSALYSQRLQVFFLDNKSKVIGLLLALSAVSLILSPIKNLIAGEWFNLAAGFLIIILSGGLEEREEKKIFKFIVLSAYIICALAFYEILFKGQFPPSSTLINPNSLALFSLMIIPFALSIKNYALACIVFIVLILTASLAGLMALLAALLFYLAKTYGIKNKKFIVPLLSLGLIMLVYAFAGLDFKSLVDRLIWWRDGFKIFADRMAFGFGFGSFSFVYPAYHESAAGGISSIYAHNYFLEFLAENGLISSIIWFVFLAGSFIKGRPVIKYSILAVLLHSFVDFGLSLPFNFWLFCFILGINNKPLWRGEYKKIIHGKFYALIVFCLLVASLNYGYKRLKLNVVYGDIIQSLNSGEVEAGLNLIDEAIIIDGNNSLIYKLKGDFYLNAARAKKDEAMPGAVSPHHLLARYKRAYVSSDCPLDNKQVVGSRTMSIKTAKFLFFEAAAAFEEALIFNPYDKGVYKELLRIYEYAGEKKLINDIKSRRIELLK